MANSKKKLDLMEIQIYFLYTLQFDENTLQLVQEYPSPSPNKGLPLKEERLKIYIKSLEKLLIEITLLIFLELCSRRDKFLALQWMVETKSKTVLSRKLGLRRHFFHSFAKRVLHFQ
jgi:hypothetical protein